MASREIHGHEVNECNRAIRITADDPDTENGNSSHVYDITWQERDESGMHIELCFQHGPITEVGTNGVTHEALIAIIIDRLKGFQSGKYACRENALALTKLEEAAMWLNERTRQRELRGVEGTLKV